MSFSASKANQIDQLVQLLARLPGLGPRSARRAVLHLIQEKEKLMTPLAKAMEEALQHVVICNRCGNIDVISPCHMCADPRRETGTLCVVETVGDLWALERAKAVDGRYHVLGGVISPLDGIGPEDLRIDTLMQRIATEDIKEVIIAVNATVEGQATAHYLAEFISDKNVPVTRLAHGVPVGGELDYLDEGTLSAAMRQRRPI